MPGKNVDNLNGLLNFSRRRTAGALPTWPIHPLQINRDALTRIRGMRLENHTAECLPITIFLFFVALTLGTCYDELPKPGYTRTMLKVSRSLPGETEELKVRTSEGNVATLIVKRRDKSSFTNDSKLTPKPIQEESNFTEENKRNFSINLQNEPMLDEKNEGKRKDEVRKLEEAQIEQIRATFSKFSEPKDEKSDINRANKRLTSERSQPISVIDYGNWTPLDAEGRALKQEEPEEEEEYRNWKPLQTNLDTAVEERTNYDRLGEAFGSDILFARNFQDRAQKNFKLNDRSVANEDGFHYMYIPHIVSTRTNIGANLSKNRDGKAVPPEVIVRSEINVKTTPKRSPLSLDIDGTPIVHGTRVSDEPIDKIQTWRNARVINNKLVTSEGSSTVTTEPLVEPSDDNAEKKEKFEKFFKDVNRRYGRNYDEEAHNVYFEWDPRNYKSEALKAEVYEPRNDHYRASIHKRMLHPDGIANYPISQRYTPESQTIAPVALKPGARAPVLQYAHPELGVQPAKILKNEKRRPDNFPENQHSFTEQRHKKKYVLNNKNLVDSYTTKNYYPNQHFYGLKRPYEPSLWVKISENLKNQFSTGVERVSQFTRPVIDPLVEATHKISQNLGLSKGSTKEAQNKIDTVATGTSILIPALGLVASGAALGIGAVAVGRYLDVDVLKRSNVDEDDLEHKRALETGAYLKTIEDENLKLNEATPQTLYVLQNVPQNDKARNEDMDSAESDGVFLVLEEDKRNDEKIENRESKQVVDEADYVETNRRKRRSLDYLDIFKADTDMKNLVRSKRFQRKGADSISEIVEIDLPAGSDRIDITEFLIPKKNKRKHSSENAILVVEDSLKIPTENFQVDTLQDFKSNLEKETINRRRKRSVENNQELLDTLQNLENAEVAEVAHIQGEWTNTPCAKRIFCDTMIQRGSDASVLMEKKMTALLRLIQPGAAAQVSSHFEEVMDAVRRHDCSSFLCPQAKPSNIFF
ncbi:hypothetical protein ALC57_12635 [Trachymyrmex cornetzi]|uniref:Uncharacterized protein n=1 Tax=Trachymyrmex cornetzi TaxID=471704 RepID=A0A195DQE7_9HYME|nr:hypothetical protein ALC57_12635 [Trachymyrmex cornetzi]